MDGIAGPMYGLHWADGGSIRTTLLFTEWRGIRIKNWHTPL
ncbi:hypothetical protein [Parasulfitobacter algicola]|nr:hypothetical protein [Sulfitobacter algicola]